MSSVLFPFHEFWWLYLAFTAAVLALLALDLGLFHRKAHAVSFREASVWTAIWIGLAGCFGAGLYWWSAGTYGHEQGRRLTMEFFTGYVIEESLSIDNMFVFALVFRQMGVSAALQHRVLFYGILGALLFRAVFIAAGAALMEFAWVPVLFGVFLIISGIRFAFSSDDAAHPSENLLVRVARRMLPVSPEFDGSRFFTVRDGRRMMTPLLVALLALELTDIVFALDSVPAIFAVTSEPFLVYTSNIFAILGLRSMYFLLAGALDRFHLLKYGLAFVLVFVGLKMAWLDQAFDGHFPISVSLLVICSAIVVALALSLWATRNTVDGNRTASDV